MTDPRLRERITARYNVPEDDNEDPTGAAPGSRVNVETDDQYQRKCEEYEDREQEVLVLD